jgi:hypothetical protein
MILPANLCPAGAIRRVASPALSLSVSPHRLSEQFRRGLIYTLCDNFLSPLCQVVTRTGRTAIMKLFLRCDDESRDVSENWFLKWWSFVASGPSCVEVIALAVITVVFRVSSVSILCPGGTKGRLRGSEISFVHGTRV